jgi:hypothetical protein
MFALVPRLRCCVSLRVREPFQEAVPVLTYFPNEDVAFGNRGSLLKKFRIVVVAAHELCQFDDVFVIFWVSPRYGC